VEGVIDADPIATAVRAIIGDADGKCRRTARHVSPSMRRFHQRK
jgi:hypothetical protein